MSARRLFLLIASTLLLANPPEAFAQPGFTSYSRWKEMCVGTTISYHWNESNEKINHRRKAKYTVTLIDKKPELLRLESEIAYLDGDRQKTKKTIEIRKSDKRKTREKVISEHLEFVKHLNKSYRCKVIKSEFKKDALTGTKEEWQSDRIPGGFLKAIVVASGFRIALELDQYSISE